ncbi:MAG TPA: oligosaccharide flippase family protein [Candidatus Acidoferrales bacterium]|nr:oligosaccharide flippase family protein [Candidatus Acidoferrales bacterium]
MPTNLNRNHPLNRKQLLWNALSTFAQVLASAAVLFFLYRFLIRALGIERLGIWSLVLATTSLVVLANQGFSTSIVKFVAQYVARGSAPAVSALLQTALLSLGLGVAVISIALYPLGAWILKIIVPASALPEAIALLPWALVSLWLNVLLGLLQAGLAGHELYTLVNFVEVSGSALYLASAFLLVPRHGLLGLAYAQAAVAAACLIATWILLRRRLPALPLIPRRWSTPLFREFAAYALQFQFITASQAFREPVTKALITKFGGLAMTGFYDMASRWVVTFRELIVQANQVLVPTVSGLREREPGAIPRLYRESYRLVFFLAVPLFSLLVALSPLVSVIWIGHFEPIFIAFVAILAAGWLVNILCNPAYVADLGTGALRWVTTGCLATAFLNLVAGFGAGKLWGGTAVVAASMASLSIGYFIVLISFHREHRISIRHLLPKESLGVSVAAIVGSLISLPVLSATVSGRLFSIASTAAILAAFCLLLIVPVWMHPLRRRLLAWVFSRVAA